MTKINYFTSEKRKYPFLRDRRSDFGAHVKQTTLRSGTEVKRKQKNKNNLTEKQTKKNFFQRTKQESTKTQVSAVFKITKIFREVGKKVELLIQIGF